MKFWTGAVFLAVGLVVVGSAPLPAAIKSKKSTAPNIASNVGVTGQTIAIIQPDPKNPAKPLWKIWAKSVYGKPNPGGKGYQASLKGVSAMLFQKGVPQAKLVAPQAVGDSARDTVFASGGVLVRSLTEHGTTLRADTVTWYANTNKVVAAGHVFYRNGKNGTTVLCPALVADTKLNTIRSSGSGQAVLPKGF